MTDRTPEAHEVEALALVLYWAEDGIDLAHAWAQALEDARTVLASDWLTQRDAALVARAKAEALRQFARNWADWVVEDAPQTRGGAAYRAIAEAQAIERAEGATS